MATQPSLLLTFSSLCCGIYGLPEYCYNYYSEFALDEHYNPGIYPEVNTTLTDITTLYKVSEVGSSLIEIYFALIINMFNIIQDVSIFQMRS